MSLHTSIRMAVPACALIVALGLGYVAGAQETPKKPETKPESTLKVGEVLRVGDKIITAEDLIARIYDAEMEDVAGKKLVEPSLLYLRDVALLELESKRLGLELASEEIDTAAKQQIDSYKEMVKRKHMGVLTWKDWLKNTFGMTEEEFEVYARDRMPVLLKRRVLVNHFMQTAEGIEVWHILVSRKGDAEKIYDQLAKEDPAKRHELFQELAVQNSEDRSSNLNRGRVGRINKHAWSIEPAEAEAALWALKDGEVAKPLKSSFGWHVFMRKQTFTPAPRTFAEMRAELIKAPDVDANASNTWVLYVRNTQKYVVEQRVPGINCKPNQKEGK